MGVGMQGIRVGVQGTGLEMLGMQEMRRIRVVIQGMGVEMREIGVGMQRIR